MLEIICSITGTCDIDNNTQQELLEDSKSAISRFKLPISYLDSSELYKISETVKSDLELVPVVDTSCMYDYLFLPKHEFAKSIMPLWLEHYTTNTDFLLDTQNVLNNMNIYTKTMTMTAPVQCDKIAALWDVTKNDSGFLEHYNYMEWDFLKYLNHSSSFLQCISFMNVASPVISLCIPVLFVIVPFVLLKVQGIPISFNNYIEVLKEVAKHHFIGKTIASLQNISWEKMVYIIATFAIYVLQIYQNVTSCMRFYKNMKNINESLIELRGFTDHSCLSMSAFLEISKEMKTYNAFRTEVEIQLERMHRLGTELKNITAFTLTMGKFADSGYLLKCFYELHQNPEYEECIRFAMGFEGYMNNMNGVYSNILAGHVHFAKIDSLIDASGNSTEFVKQFYPPLLSNTEKPVKNTCKFDKNMILSSPNKSGKTTILKTTAINIIFSQQFGCGFYKSAKLTPYTHIHSYLNIPDTSGRDSLFQAESRRCKEIIDVIQENNLEKHRHFSIFDELYSGTNPVEASKAGYAFLEYLSGFSNVDFILTTHYFSICKKFKESDKIANYKMDVVIREDGTFDYTYRIKRGISKIKGAVRVLKDMGYPKEIIDAIEKTK
uniref:DNA mismatch repair proteins mutS family domain-containing protein n=1 Tax=viral metagenome TaxID=1070528 RepID=A0A6C0AU05_9ZZZZ